MNLTDAVVQTPKLGVGMLGRIYRWPMVLRAESALYDLTDRVAGRLRPRMALIHG